MSVDLDGGRSRKSIDQSILELDNLFERIVVVTLELQYELMVHGPFLAANLKFAANV